MAGAKNLVVLRVFFVKLHLFKKIITEKICWFADASDVEKGDARIKQDPSSRKRKHEENSKEDYSAEEFIASEKFKTEAATKEKTR